MKNISSNYHKMKRSYQSGFKKRKSTGDKKKKDAEFVRDIDMRNHFDIKSSEPVSTNSIADGKYIYFNNINIVQFYCMCRG